MKFRFYYYDISKYLKDIPENSLRIQHTLDMINTPEQIRKPYSQYLLSSLDSDFSENRFGSLDKILEKIDQIERGDIESYCFESNGFLYHVNQKSILFEHAIFGVCPHWPLWSCPLLHYKIAVQAARDFFAMPVSLDTELIIELPESDMAQVTLFPPILAENEMALEKNPSN